MRLRTADAGERDFLALLHEKRAIKLMRFGGWTPEDERRWARLAGLPVAELRRRAKAASPRM